jgi:hypothetical protein
MPGKRPLVVMLPWLLLAGFAPDRSYAQEREDSPVQLMSAPQLLSAPSQPSSVTIAEAQKELHRLRCYWGEINGVWTVSTRAAAQKFIDRVNARLPVDVPDGALLALLRSETSPVCGECPVGQAADTNGRCLPAALLKKPRPRPSTIETGSLPDQPRIESTSAERSAQREAASPPRQADQKPGSAEPAASGGQRTANKPTYWSKLISKIDKALGL